MKIGPRFERRVELDDNRRVKLRLIRPEDRDALSVAFHKLAPETRYRRFMGHVSTLTPPMLTYLTELDGQNHFAIVAVPVKRRRGEPIQIVGVARFIRLRGHPSSAEMAVTVADEMQNLGLGTKLVEVLVEAAAERGIDTLVAHMLEANASMHRLLEKSGPLGKSEDGAVVVKLSPPKRRLARAFSWLRWPRTAA
jgi:RimJ/RimL family protein N-acetyltransferase